MRPPLHAFWRFSLRTYRAPGVQAACLALQQSCGADVNLLLLCGWLGRGGRSIDKGRLREAMRCVGAWQSDVVAPVRQSRRAIKANPPRDVDLAQKLRRQMLALELELEFVEQSMLAELAARWPAPVRNTAPEVAIAANLARYLALLGPTTPASAAHVACIAGACGATARGRAAGSIDGTARAPVSARTASGTARSPGTARAAPAARYPRRQRAARRGTPSRSVCRATRRAARTR